MNIMKIGDFENLTDQDLYEVYDEERGEWVDYKDSCYYPKGGFPNIQTANEEILLISVMDNLSKRIVTFGTQDYVNTKAHVRYVKCDTESNMLKQFLNFWCVNYPDVITGWNVTGFDIPYLVRRFRYLNIDCEALSPWKMIRDEKTYINDEQVEIFSLPGIAILDYLELYKKFTFSARESYKLDHIAEVELGENKLDNPYNSFKDFYTKDPQRFVDYNIHDVYLVDKLEDRLKLIVLAYTLAYKAKVNYQDVYSPVKTWDILIYNYLRDRNIVIPFKASAKAVPFVGGYVKDPNAGIQKWVASFDLTSLYPHLIMQYNMSPETITDTQLYVPIDELVEGTADTSEAAANNYSVTANGWCYNNNIRGFLPNLMDSLYEDRNKAKKEMLRLEQEYENTKDPMLEKEIARLDTLQLALKVTLNSGYGAVTNQYFRYFDMRIGEGITMSGQLSSRWIARKVNEFMNKTFKTTEIDYVIYQDTDSMYLSLEAFINLYGSNKTKKQCIELMNKFCAEVIQPYIDRSYKELATYMNAYEQKMYMKLEVLADIGIFYKKKHYVLNVFSSEGVIYNEPKLKVVGLSMVKSSTPEVCRGSLRESIKIALSGDEKQIQDFVESSRVEFNNCSIPEIAFPRSANNMENFSSNTGIYTKGTPIHVRGALLYNHHLKRLGLEKQYPVIKSGEKVKFVYLKMPNPFYENVIAFPVELPKEFGLNSYIDYDVQFEKAYISALEDLIEPMKWSVSKQSTLEDFF
jgi:DNA polymerase elongation subunit (family B)